MRNNLSLSQKFLAAVVLCVISAIAVLTILIVRRETGLIRAEHRKNAEIMTTAISKALSDNMLGGRPEDTRRLIRELSGIQGVKELSVLGPDESKALHLSLPDAVNGEELRGEIRPGDEYFFKPLRNEKECQSCHQDRELIRGVVVVRMSSFDIADNVKELVGRMSMFGALTAFLLSGILVLLSRRMIISGLKGLTETTDRIARGDYVFFKPRGVDCHKIMGCGNTGCPSYSDKSIPCWLQSGTLCTGEAVGHFALKMGNCRQCRVFKKEKGDEIVQLQDNFNRMSLTLKSHEQEVKGHIKDIEGLNQELVRSNTKLSTLLVTSRLTTSTLELEQTLSASMKIILDVTSLKVGVILLLEDDTSRKCHDYFDCNAFNCPAYRDDTNCWRLSGTMCHSSTSGCPDNLSPLECWNTKLTHTHHVAVGDFDEKVHACANCAFFANVVLIPKMATGFAEDRIGERIKIDSRTLHRALLRGQTIVDYSKENPFSAPFDTVTEIAMPLKSREQMIGILYLASDEEKKYSDGEIEFFQFLSEIISSGILNSRIFDEIETSYFQTVISLSNAIEAKDPYTKGHSVRVAELCMRIAEVLNLSRQEKEHLRFAAILHDIGKIGIGRNLLWKISGLDDDEVREIRDHPDMGVQILSPVHFLRPVLPAIWHHHEKFDGSGYPHGLKGRGIPFKARIICVADAWDAMMSSRPYRPAFSKEAAIAELKRCSGVQFDPEIVEVFIERVLPES
jgi:putative nucleotidyltransferase with HDIG domain